MTDGHICAGCSMAIRRLLSAMSDEVATRIDPALKGGVTDLSWNKEIMVDAIKHLRSHGESWRCAQLATAELLGDELTPGNLREPEPPRDKPHVCDVKCLPGWKLRDIIEYGAVYGLHATEAVLRWDAEHRVRPNEAPRFNPAEEGVTYG